MPDTLVYKAGWRTALLSLVGVGGLVALLAYFGAVMCGVTPGGSTRHHHAAAQGHSLLVTGIAAVIVACVALGLLWQVIGRIASPMVWTGVVTKVELRERPQDLSRWRVHVDGRSWDVFADAGDLRARLPVGARVTIRYRKATEDVVDIVRHDA